MQHSRKAPVIATALAGLAGLVGCAGPRIVPNTDVFPQSNSISVGVTGGNQTTAVTANLSHRQPIPLNDNRTFGALASVEGSASDGTYNRAEDTDTHATQLDGRISLGLYGAGNGGKFISLSPSLRVANVQTDGTTKSRMQLGYGAEVIAQTPLGGEFNYLRVSAGGSALDERTNYERGFDGKGNGGEIHLNTLYDIWAHVQPAPGQDAVPEAQRRQFLEQKVSLALGGSFSQVSRDVDGQVNGNNVEFSENERRAAVSLGLVYFNNNAGLYVMPGARANFIDISRRGVASNQSDSATTVGPFLEAGLNLFRLFDRDATDDNKALFLRAQVGANFSNRREHDEAYGSLNLTFGY